MPVKQTIKAIKKETIGNTKERKEIQNRLNRIIGTMNGIKKMVDEGKTCDEVLTQLSAAINASKSVANFVLTKHLENYVSEEIKTGNSDDAIKNVISYIKRFE